MLDVHHMHAAAVARRLQSLGALTRGDRRAASGIDLSESNFDSPLGRKSLRRMYDAIVQESPTLPSGVTLTSILGDCLRDEGEILQKVLQRLPEGGIVSPEQQIPAGERPHPTPYAPPPCPVSPQRIHQV